MYINNREFTNMFRIKFFLIIKKLIFYDIGHYISQSGIWFFIDSSIIQYLKN